MHVLKLSDSKVSIFSVSFLIKFVLFSKHVFSQLFRHGRAIILGSCGEEAHGTKNGQGWVSVSLPS